MQRLRVNVACFLHFLHEAKLKEREKETTSMYKFQQRERKFDCKNAN